MILSRLPVYRDLRIPVFRYLWLIALQTTNPASCNAIFSPHNYPAINKIACIISTYYVFLKFTSTTNINTRLTDNPLYNEHELLCRIANGDETAFTLLLRQFRNKVYTQSLVYLKSAVTAQEITQDIFLKVWANRLGLPQVENFSGYLFIITRNEIVSALRKKGHEQIAPSETLKENGWLPDQQLLYKESYKLLLEGIEALPPARKNVFKMSRLEGLSYEEIAERLDISRNGVKDHIVKSLIFLRNFLHTHTGDTFILFWVLGELAIP